MPDDKMMTFGNVKVPVYRSVGDVMTETAKLTYDQQVAIIVASGRAVPPGLDAKLILYTAASFIQNAWYVEQQGVVPEAILAKHEKERMAQFDKAVEDVLKNPPVIEQPKAPRAEAARKADAGGKAPKQHKELNFGIGTADPANLKGQYKQVYAAAMTVNATNLGLGVSEQQLVAEALAKGFTTKEKNVPYRIRWLALQLIKTGHLYALGTQAELPVIVEEAPNV